MGVVKRMTKMVKTVHWLHFYLSPDTLLVVFCRSDFTLQSISSIQAQESSKLSWPPSTQIISTKYEANRLTTELNSLEVTLSLWVP